MELSALKPNWQAAKLHGKSTQVGLPHNTKSKLKPMICPCCLNIVNKDKAPLCQNSKQLQFLGFGFPLFYIFLKYCIILLVISVASYNTVSLYWAALYNAQLCRELHEGCSSVMVEIARISKTVNTGEVVIRIFSFIIHLGVLLYIRDIITKTRNYYDQRTCSLSDYSIMITNLPKRDHTKNHLANFLQKYLQKKYFIHQFTFLPEHEQFYAMEQQGNKIINDLRPLILNQEQNKEQIIRLEKELQKKQDQLIQYCNKEIQLEKSDLCKTEKVIFSCWTEDEKEQILKQFEDVPQERLRQAFYIPPDQECSIQFSEAPEPKEINWQHINFPSSQRLVRMIAGWLMTTIFLAVITIVFFLILSEKTILMGQTFKDENSYQIGLFIVYLALMCVILFNKFVMGFVLHKICDFQRHPTTDKQQFHFAVKYSVGMFFTTALMTVAVEDIRFHNFYDHPYGVIEEETIMFILNGVFVPFLWIVNPWHIVVLIKRRMNVGRVDLTQKEANKIMQNVQYDMGKRYAQIIQIMWFTFLYSSLIPLGAFLSIFGLCLYYWIDKYNLLRRSSVNSNIAGELSLYSMKLLDFTLLFKPLGEILFDSQIRDSYCITSIAMAAFAILYLALPIDDFLKYLHPEKFKNEEKNFKEASLVFKDTYQTLHPIFSLKSQNQQKMYRSFRDPKNAKKVNFENIFDGQVESVESNPVRIQLISDDDSMRDDNAATEGILKALFERHDAFNVRIKQKCKQTL